MLDRAFEGLSNGIKKYRITIKFNLNLEGMFSVLRWTLFSAAKWKSQHLGRVRMSRNQLLDTVRRNLVQDEKHRLILDEENPSRNWCRATCRALRVNFLKPKFWDGEMFQNLFQDQLKGVAEQVVLESDGVLSHVKKVVLAVVFECCLPCVLGCLLNVFVASANK